MFNLKFWISLFISTLLTMLMIFIIKKMNTKVNIPFVSDAISQV